MDPFHVVRLAGDALDRCRRRVQHAIHGHLDVEATWGIYQRMIAAYREPDRGDQWATRAPPQFSPRLPQPD